MVIRTLFIYTRPAANFGNNRSATQNREFVEQAICDLLRQAQWLSVSIQAGGKKRLILVLRYPNQFLRKSKIEFEDAKTMLYSFIDCSQSWLFPLISNLVIIILTFFPKSRVFGLFLV